jgi:hypothetical protein
MKFPLSERPIFKFFLYLNQCFAKSLILWENYCGKNILRKIFVNLNFKTRSSFQNFVKIVYTVHSRKLSRWMKKLNQVSVFMQIAMGVYLGEAYIQLYIKISMYIQLSMYIQNYTYIQISTCVDISTWIRV